VAWSQQDAAYAGLEMAVNLSPRQVADPGLVRAVARTLAETGLEAVRLCLEITETAIINDADVARATLASLKELGVRLVLDDFGTGYSSLSHAKHFPIDTLKIDRSFVDGLGRDPEDAAIVAAVLSMGRALAQGYLFSRPLEADAVTALLARC